MMKWYFPKKKTETNGKSVSIEKNSTDEAAYSNDFNAPLYDQGGTCTLRDSFTETEAASDAADLIDAKKAIEESEELIPYSEIRKELGLE